MFSAPLWCICFGVLWRPAHADVTFHIREYPVSVVIEIHVAGEILKRDARDLETGFAAARKFAAARRKSVDGPHFLLNSYGGDVMAGATIGRWARARQSSAEVEAECSSACVLILAGAVNRKARATAKIGIHRTYFSGLDPQSTYGQVREKISGADQFLTAYLREMDVPLALLEEMKAVPPDRVRYLSAAELQRYRLAGPDPAYQERTDNQEAARYGLARDEYYRRRTRAEADCRQGSVLSLDCWEEILTGKK